MYQNVIEREMFQSVIGKYLNTALKRNVSIIERVMSPYVIEKNLITLLNG